MAKVEDKPEAASADRSALSDERLRELFREMLLIRRFEEKVEERFRAGELPGLPARRDRPGGGRLRRLRRARAGRRDRLDAPRARPRDRQGHARRTRSWPSCTASSRAARGGYGGSMHLYDLEVGNLGANAVVGGGLPAIVGAALAFQLRERAARRGRVLRRRRDEHRHVPRVAEPRAALEGAGGLRAREQRLGGVDAGDAAASAAGRGPRQARGRVRDEARSRSTARTSRPSTWRRARRASTPSPGKGPVFLNVRTYRLTGHYVGDPQVYRDEGRAPGAARDEGSDRAPARAPRALRRGVRGARRRGDGDVEASVEFAKAGTDPKPEDALKYVYA